MIDQLSEEKIKDNLKTKIFGQKIHIFSSIPTTMDVAKAFALTDMPEGTIVISDSQTQGRGRDGRTWFSPPGVNLYCSILFRTDFAPEETQRLLCLALVASHHAIMKECGLNTSIKWPNDLISNGKKVAGFLLQNELKGSELDFSILGIGLNVNTLKTDWPPDLVNLASSLYLETGRVFSRANILSSLLNELERFYNLLNEDGFREIKMEWLKFWGQLNKPIRIMQPGGIIKGLGKDLDDCGYIILELEDGKRKTIYVGDPV